MNWVLRGVRGAHAHAIYVLDVSVILGRSASADIQILDQRVSRQHARILVTSDEVILEDLGSHNGTFVHGHQVHRRPLRSGDRIQIGVSEYVFDQIKGRVLTSAVFLNKLTTRDTMGATAVKKRVAKEILTSPTADMPVQGDSPEIEARVPEPEPQAAPSTPAAPEPSSAEEPEPEYLRRQRELAVRLPTPLPGELQWSLHPSGDEDTDDEPTAATEPEPEPTPEPRPESRVPPPPPAASMNPFSPEIEAVTVPLDPRSQRVHTPVPESAQSPAPVAPPPEPEPTPEPEDDPSQEAALRTIDAVVRLLKLRAQESDGALLKIQDRENLRRLEGALRESRRNKANRRRWTRLPCQLSAQVGDAAEARVTDIGAGGLRISGGGLRVQPGDAVTIRVHLGDGPLARIAVFQTRVAWTDDGAHSFGAIFDGPAHWELAS